MDNIDELMGKLKELRYYYKCSYGDDTLPVISSEGYKDVEILIRQYLLDNHDAEFGTLQAKVYAYESIIANSNFAPVIADAHQSKNETHGDICHIRPVDKFERFKELYSDWLEAHKVNLAEDFTYPESIHTKELADIIITVDEGA